MVERMVLGTAPGMVLLAVQTAHRFLIPDYSQCLVGAQAVQKERLLVALVV